MDDQALRLRCLDAAIACGVHDNVSVADVAQSIYDFVSASGKHNALAPLPDAPPQPDTARIAPDAQGNKGVTPMAVPPEPAKPA